MNLAANIRTDALIIVENDTKGKVFTCSESLSFWGGVDPDTGKIIDSHHPNHGVYLAGKIVLMPSSRGSCSGSGVLLQLARNNIAPAAIVFCEAEEILTLGAIIAAKLFDSPVAILRLPIKIYEELSNANTAKIKNKTLEFSNKSVPLSKPNIDTIKQRDSDRSMISW